MSVRFPALTFECECCVAPSLVRATHITSASKVSKLRSDGNYPRDGPCIVGTVDWRTKGGAYDAIGIRLIRAAMCATREALLDVERRDAGYRRRLGPLSSFGTAIFLFRVRGQRNLHGVSHDVYPSTRRRSSSEWCYELRTRPQTRVGDGQFGQPAPEQINADYASRSRRWTMSCGHLHPRD